MSHPTYELHTLHDMLQIPPDRLDAFLPDLKMFLLSARAMGKGMEALGNAIHPDLEMGIRARGMTWIDDGINAIQGVHFEMGDQKDYFPNPNFPQPE